MKGAISSTRRVGRLIPEVSLRLLGWEWNLHGRLAFGRGGWLGGACVSPVLERMIDKVLQRKGCAESLREFLCFSAWHFSFNEGSCGLAACADREPAGLTELDTKTALASLIFLALFERNSA